MKNIILLICFLNCFLISFGQFKITEKLISYTGSLGGNYEDIDTVLKSQKNNILKYHIKQIFVYSINGRDTTLSDFQKYNQDGTIQAIHLRKIEKYRDSCTIQFLSDNNGNIIKIHKHELIFDKKQYVSTDKYLWLTYDKNNKVKQVKSFDNRFNDKDTITTQFDYYPNGLIKTLYERFAHITHYNYDANWKLINGISYRGDTLLKKIYDSKGCLKMSIDVIDKDTLKIINDINCNELGKYFIANDYRDSSTMKYKNNNLIEKYNCSYSYSYLHKWRLKWSNHIIYEYSNEGLLLDEREFNESNKLIRATKYIYEYY